MHKWSATPEREMSKGKYLGTVEFQDKYGEWHDFEVIATPRRIVFGGSTNNMFIESGFFPRDDIYFGSLDAQLQEMLADLEVYYNDGKRYVQYIVTSVRM
jgi:hypothetical protein